MTARVSLLLAATVDVVDVEGADISEPASHTLAAIEFDGFDAPSLVVFPSRLSPCRRIAGTVFSRTFAADFAGALPIVRPPPAHVCGLFCARRDNVLFTARLIPIPLVGSDTNKPRSLFRAGLFEFRVLKFMPLSHP